MSQFVEVTRRGFGGRSKDSIGGALFGFVLVAVGTVALFLNEGRAVKRYKDLKEGAGAVVTVEAGRVDPSMDGRLVHLSGETKTEAPLVDPDFGVSVDAVRLVRSVEMYQWVEVVKTETKNKVGGGTEETKTYTYERRWLDQPVDSSQFKVSGEHRNPSEMKYRSATITAPRVGLEAFVLSPSLVGKIGGGKPLSIESLEGAPEEVLASSKLAEGSVYFGANPSSPAVGDLRVRFSMVPTGPVSVVAAQSGSTFVPYTAKTGGTVELLELGIVSAADMFKMAQDRNKALTWLFRVGGFFLLGIAFSMILRPISVFASILPFLGRLVGVGTTFLGFLLAGILWTVTVAIAWIFYRPVLGVALLVVTVSLLAVVIRSARRPKANAPAATAAAGPPPLA
jgi:hypothetical protein